MDTYMYVCKTENWQHLKLCVAKTEEDKHCHRLPSCDYKDLRPSNCVAQAWHHTILHLSAANEVYWQKCKQIGWLVNTFISNLLMEIPNHAEPLAGGEQAN